MSFDETIAAQRQAFAHCSRIVVKVGSSLLIDSEAAALRGEWLESLCHDVADRISAGTQVVLVSSGAVALGAKTLAIDPRRAQLNESQAAAAAGQIELAHRYRETFLRRNIAVAQLLVTLDDSEDRRRYLNARDTLETLLSRGVVPVVNENDTVATAEIRYGDNDRLAARVAQMASADFLVILSDVDGLYDANPQTCASAAHVPLVTSVTPEIVAMAAGPGSSHGAGGMRTKLAAAEIALPSGCAVVIANGHAHHPLKRLLDGAQATWFTAIAKPAAARKRWIAASLKPRGTLRVDQGAVAALVAGKSLLPAGVVSVSGGFGRGDAVQIVNEAGEEIARGLVSYSADEAERIAGRRSNEILGLLGYRGRDEVVHRDNLALTDP